METETKIFFFGDGRMPTDFFLFESHARQFYFITYNSRCSRDIYEIGEADMNGMESKMTLKTAELQY